MSTKIIVDYVTSNANKRAENDILVEHCQLDDGTPVRDLFEFRIRQVSIKEILEVDLRALVIAEVSKAYSEIKVPCIVEHAGLVFEGYEKQSYPGGLTKPMWNALKERFVVKTRSDGRRAVAQAVVAYCDGLAVQTFIGETWGTIADRTKGSTHDFYWDSVFMPDVEGRAGSRTYAEIINDETLGLKHKVIKLSQSTKAMLQFLEFRRNAVLRLWQRR